ncbi:hypothetical protein [Nonomuraea basaltis]|uniref:hypothetical protein n=1 Tax=Nonomuraea basaltis TaxID=2495887 RepID=UPI00110C6502|nr:hypothetical protein [Nonomuraea basaltis]TMR99630.1 hypothetical protein EJK15_06140 [Nonomuraea basaltis]
MKIIRELGEKAMKDLVGKLGDGMLAMIVPQRSAAAVECYYIYKCVAGVLLRARCCDGSCAKYEIRCNSCC